MSEREVLPITPIYPNPEPQEASYLFVARTGLVDDRGSWWNGANFAVEGPRLEHLQEDLSTIKNPAKSKLSWVEFFQHAVIKVRHPARFDGVIAGPLDSMNGEQGSVEEVHGMLFPAASPQLVIGASKEGFTFASVNEILERGAVTPFMEGWLKRYSNRDNSRGFNKFLIPILPLLDPQLSGAIRDNKFHDFDFDT